MSISVYFDPSDPTEKVPIPIMYRAHDPILHTEDNGYWCDEPSCPCRQDRSYCERYVKVEVSE